MTDRELIRRAQAGDEKAFASLVRHYESRVAATVIGMLGPGPEAEDVGQEVFIRLHRGLPGFRAEAGLGTYVTRIAMNLCYSRLRRRRARKLLFSSRSEDDARQKFAEDAVFDAVDNRQTVAALLQQLPPRFRSVIILRILEGYSVRETARILKLPQGTVLSRLSRGLEKIRQFVQFVEE